MNLCRDCTHARQQHGVYQCAHPDAGPSVSPVDGAVMPAYCSVERLCGGRCGEDGSRYEARDEKAVAA